MRKELQKIVAERNIFIGTFERFGLKTAFRGNSLTTVLLKEIKNKDGNIVSDHCWFNLTKGFDVLLLKEGDVVKFEARVKEYEKGYKGYRGDVYKPIEYDYKLSHPTKIQKLIKCS